MKKVSLIYIDKRSWHSPSGQETVHCRSERGRSSRPEC